MPVCFPSSCAFPFKTEHIFRALAVVHTIHWLIQGDLQVSTLFAKAAAVHQQGNYDITNHGHKVGELISKRPKESFYFLAYDQKFMAH